MLNQTTEQPSGDSGAPSLDSRIDSIFSGKPTPAPNRQPQQQAPQQETQEEPEVAADSESTIDDNSTAETPEETFELELEGDKYVLPKKLEKAVLQERDYTQKSQTLADQRRLVELKEQQFRTRELQQTFHTDVANEVQQMQMIDAVLKQPVNWQGMTTDEAFRHKIQLDDLKQQRDQLSQAVNQKYQTWTTQQQAAQAELQRKTIEVLRSRIPTWSDAVANEVTAHFRERGLTDADFQAMNQNPVYIEAAYKAMQFDKLQAKATKTVEQAKAVKTTSARPMPQQVKEHLAYRKALAKAPEGSPERKRVVDAKVASIFSR
jgi:hypothetical protein